MNLDQWFSGSCLLKIYYSFCSVEQKSLCNLRKTFMCNYFDFGPVLISFFSVSGQDRVII